VPIRFYVDADLKGIGKILVLVRPDVTFPGDRGGQGPDGQLRAPCAIQQGDKDPDWIPLVARAGWVIITRDRHLKHRPAELSAIVSNGARVVRLDPRHALNRWGQLEIVVGQWRRIEALATTTWSMAVHG